MQSSIIHVEDRKIELYFSTRAMMKISERCGGDIAGLSEWFSDSKGTAEQLEKISLIIADLANGAVIKHNADIALGLEAGEKYPLYPDEYFIDVLNPRDIVEYKGNIFEAMGLGSEFEIPDGVAVVEKDADLAEIEAAKAGKNAAGA